MKFTLETAVREALAAMGAEPPGQIDVEIPRDAGHGDLSTPVAMGLARELKRAPRQIAEQIVAHLPGRERFSSVEVAGPGFINVTFSPAWLQAGTGRILAEGAESLRVDMGKGRPIQIEFVSANPTGPLHLGHGRGAAIGHALCNLLEAAGYDVTREYYVNDAGRQVGLLGQSVHCRYMGLFGLDRPLPEDGYRGDYIEDAARDLRDEFGGKFVDVEYAQCAPEITAFSLDRMLALIKDDLSAFGVEFDTWQSEKALHTHGAVTHAIDFLRERGLIYEEGGALWFKATAFGDDKDRVVVKADGMHTYFASDIAYHLKKVEDGFDEVIDIWGADHHGYIPRMEAVMDALGKGREKLTVLLVQMVSLMRGGEPVQMSKRAGTFVTLREVMDEVGADTTKFIFLTRRHDSQLTFDLETAKSESSENPVFYVQYANARIQSLMAKAREAGMDTSLLESADLSPLVGEDETMLMRTLLRYRMAFEQAARSREPHRIAAYLQELAGVFHPFYKRNRVVGEAMEVARARLALCRAVRLVVREGLTILGLSVPDQM
jgi:arginyl-tRNA synthetase